MRGIRILVASTLFGVMTAAGGGPALAQSAPAPAPDNTKVNKSDREERRPTADQQKENQADRDLVRRVRRAITSDKALSTYARNVKIIAQDGKVTLRGPVRSEEEKQAIEAKAVQVAGDGNVTSEIQIAEKRG